MIAVDSHLHILDPRFEGQGGTHVPDGFTVPDYKKARAAFGTNRAVVVQSKTYGTDPACLLDALSQFGPEGRGIAVPDLSVKDEMLADMNAAGVCGVRFSLWNPDDSVATFDTLVPFAERLHDLGWHAQLHMNADQIVETADTLRALPCDMVYDHMGRLPPGPNALDHPAFALVRDLANEGRAWVKLTGPYLNRRNADRPEDWTRIGRAWVDAIPKRLVWGSDWPHVTEQPNPPTNAMTANTLGVWCDQDADLVETILSKTPSKLYGFV